MILDSQTVFSGSVAADGTRAGQAITATAISANVLDLRNSASPALVDEGILGGAGLWLVVSVGQAFNNLTSLGITLESDSAVGLNGTPTVHYSATVALAALTAGAQVVRLPLPSADYKRYLGLRYTVNGTAPSTGTLTAALSFDINRNVTYPGSFTVDV